MKNRALKNLGCWLAAWLVPVASFAVPLFINEVLFNPPGGDDLSNEYVELRGTPNDVLPAGLYFVSVEGDANGNPGTVQNVFDLSGRRIGGNGFLVLLQKTNAYAANTNATLLVNTGSGGGFGSGSSSSIGHKGEGGQVDFENGSATFLLIQTTNKPVIGVDIDANNDGMPDGIDHESWTVLDSVGVLDADGLGDIAYGAINYRRNAAAMAPGIIVAVGFTPGWVGRSGNTTVSSASAWVAGDNLAGTAPNWSLGSAANTAPAGSAGLALNHVGGPNFGAPAIPGVIISKAARLQITEGEAGDAYAIAFNVAPTNLVTVELRAGPQVQFSTDGGVTFTNVRALVFSNTTPRAIQVRALDDNVVNASPHHSFISHAITNTADATRYPLTTVIPNLVVAIMENDSLLLTELKVNPPGSADAPCEFIEIKGPPNALLTNVYLLVIEGNTELDPGRANVVVNLTGKSLGSSGLLVIAAAGHPYAIPGTATVVTNAHFNTVGGGLGNGTISFLLVGTESPLVEGADLDDGDNGVLEELPEDIAIMDAVGWSDGGGGDVVYGGVTLTLASATPDAAARFPGNVTPLSAAAWFCGDLAGTSANSLAYDSGKVSTNFPGGSVLTPGVQNNTAPAFAAIAAFSSVIGDATSPVVNFTVADAETAANLITVTAASSNPLVVPDANLTVTPGAGGARTLTVNPIGVGYATITLTAGDGSMSNQLSFPYAASAQGRLGGKFHTGVSDASSAIAIDANLMLIGDDENQTIRLFNRHNSGASVSGFDFNLWLGLTDLYPSGQPKEVDLEGSTRVGNRIYWLGSHSHSVFAENRTNRARIFAADLSGSGTNSALAFAGRYDFLKVDLIVWDSSNGHGRGSNYYGLAGSGAVGIDAKAPDGSGFNLEGLTMAPGSTSTAYLAFRAPLIPATNRAKALLVPVTNFNVVAVSAGGPGTARFGPPIELNLGGRGVRSIEGSGTNYLIVAGPPGLATGVTPHDFKLFTWSGQPGEAAKERAADLSGLNPEGIVELPAGPWSATNQFQLISDNGIKVYYGDDVQAKFLSEPKFKKFRSDWVPLGTGVVSRPFFRSIKIAGGTSTLSWHSYSGLTYRVQFIQNLSMTNWTNLGADALATDAVSVRQDNFNPAQQRFYRVIIP